AYGVFAALGVILSAVYMLHMLARVLFGPLKTPAIDHEPHDQAHQGQAASPGQGLIDYAHPGTPAPHHHHQDATLSRDINGREIAILVPIALCCLLLGLGSAFVTRSMRAPV